MRLALAAVAAFLAVGYLAGSGAVAGITRLLENLPI